MQPNRKLAWFSKNETYSILADFLKLSFWIYIYLSNGYSVYKWLWETLIDVVWHASDFVLL